MHQFYLFIPALHFQNKVSPILLVNFHHKSCPVSKIGDQDQVETEHPKKLRFQAEVFILKVKRGKGN